MLASQAQNDIFSMNGMLKNFSWINLQILCYLFDQIKSIKHFRDVLVSMGEGKVKEMCFETFLEGGK